jgi:hypothetical protein
MKMVRSKPKKDRITSILKFGKKRLGEIDPGLQIPEIGTLYLLVPAKGKI